MTMSRGESDREGPWAGAAGDDHVAELAVIAFDAGLTSTDAKTLLEQPADGDSKHALLGIVIDTAGIGATNLGDSVTASADAPAASLPCPTRISAPRPT